MDSAVHSGRRIAIIGAGVIGLSVALELRRVGAEVVVFADQANPLDCSAAAGAVWFPYGVSLDPVVLAMSRRTRERLEELAADERAGAEAGVAVRRGTFVVRREGVDLSWAEGLPDRTDAAPDVLPEGARGAVHATLPVVDMSRYLAWLARENAAAGVSFVAHRVRDLVELDRDFDAIVVACGIRSPELVADETPIVPMRGQVVRLENPGISDWVIDEDAPGGMTYVIPRFDDVVCGGTSIAGEWSTDIDDATEHAILERARTLVPALADAAIVSRAVGLRPSRSSPRVERVPREGAPTIACYGHGGAGVSLSWGSAERVVRIVDEAYTA